MPKKTIYIFIATFIVVGAIIFGVSMFMKPGSTTQTNTDTDVNTQTFNPFGGSTSTGGNTTGNTNDTGAMTDTTAGTTTPIPKLRQITDFAISGAGFFTEEKLIPESVDSATATTPVVTPTTTKATTKTKAVIIPKIIPKYEIIPSLRYIQRMNGHIYQMNLNTKVATKISNSTIPAIYEAFFDSKVSTVIYRYLSEDSSISSFMATMGGTKGEFLPQNIADIALSPDKTKYFYLIKNSSGITGTTASFSDTKRTQVFSSPFTEWLPQWVSNQNIFLTTKPSSQVAGSLFSLNITTGALSKVFGGIKGLTTLADGSGSTVLYSSSSNGVPKLGIFSTNTKKYIDLNNYGLPEKCVWSKINLSTIYCAIPSSIPNGNYPDSWYKGLVSFNDYFVRIDTSTMQTAMLTSFSGSDLIDGTNLFLDETESTLFFTNKKDYTLWSLDLK